MKTKFRMLFVAILAIVSASCQKEAAVETPDCGPVTVKAVVSANVNELSKACLDGVKLTWENGDKLVVCQYGNYASGKQRDDTLNPFSYNAGTGVFEGSIYDYHLPAEGSSYYERFYAAYPLSNVTAIGISTGKYKLKTPEVQSGKAADFGKYAAYLGYQRQRTEEPLTSYKDGVLTFLKPFDMACNSPVLKFNVPEALSVKNIVVSAFKGDVPAGIAGTIQCRCDAKILEILPTVKEIKISDGENLISGDVYVVLAPNALTPDGETEHNYMSDITSIVLDLTKDDGATATLSVALAGDVPVSGVIKNLKTLPEDVTWTYPEGPGIATIGFVGDSGQAGKFEVTTENENSTLKYSNSADRYEDVGEPTIAYPSGGIQRGNNINYVRFCTTTGVLSPRIENAMVWGFTKSKGFGVNIFDNFKDNTVGASYTYTGLTYTITTAGTGFAYPYCQSAGINFMNKDQPSYSMGYLSFSALENGTGRIMIQSQGKGRTVTVTNTTKGTSTSKSLTSSQGIVVTDRFAVSKDDVIKVEFSNSVQVQSMSFVWETAEDK